MVGKGRQGQRHWSKASHENKDSISTIKDGADVVFYGDSITEGECDCRNYIRDKITTGSVTHFL